MTRQELEQLSRSELIDIILYQQQAIEQLQTRIAQLEEEIKRLSQPPKDSSNSSLPPPKSNKANRRARPPQSKRAPNQGHPGRAGGASRPM